VFLAVKPHAIFHREGVNLLARVPISMTMATLGGKIEVPTIDGKSADLNIPEGTQNAQQFRMKNLGMIMLQQGRGAREAHRGDLFVEIQVETPVNLNKKQRELLKEFEKLGEQGNSPQAQGFFDKVKDFLKGSVGTSSWQSSSVYGARQGGWGGCLSAKFWMTRKLCWRAAWCAKAASTWIKALRKSLHCRLPCRCRLLPLSPFHLKSFCRCPMW
jgi:hypothetical protein